MATRELASGRQPSVRMLNAKWGVLYQLAVGLLLYRMSGLGQICASMLIGLILAYTHDSMSPMGNGDGYIWNVIVIAILVGDIFLPFRSPKGEK